MSSLRECLTLKLAPDMALSIADAAKKISGMEVRLMEKKAKFWKVLFLFNSIEQFKDLGLMCRSEECQAKTEHQ